MESAAIDWGAVVRPVETMGDAEVRILAQIFHVDLDGPAVIEDSEARKIMDSWLAEGGDAFDCDEDGDYTFASMVLFGHPQKKPALHIRTHRVYAAGWGHECEMEEISEERASELVAEAEDRWCLAHPDD